MKLRQPEMLHLETQYEQYLFHSLICGPVRVSTACTSTSFHNLYVLLRVSTACTTYVRYQHLYYSCRILHPYCIQIQVLYSTTVQIYPYNASTQVVLVVVVVVVVLVVPAAASTYYSTTSRYYFGSTTQVYYSTTCTRTVVHLPIYSSTAVVHESTSST